MFNGATAIIQGNRVEGFSQRPTASSLLESRTDCSEHFLTLSFGTAGTAALVSGQDWTTGEKIQRGLSALGEAELVEIQWDTVSGAVTGDGFTRVRLMIGEENLFPDNMIGNKTGVRDGFVVLLPATTGERVYNPPLRIYQWKNWDGSWAQNALVKLSLGDENGVYRSAQKFRLVFRLLTRYHQ
jgi:hypothetical protein